MSLMDRHGDTMTEPLSHRALAKLEKIRGGADNAPPTTAEHFGAPVPFPREAEQMARVDAGEPLDLRQIIS